MSIVGARPQFIKAAAFSRLARGTPGITEKLLHTGQHYDENMSSIFFEEMEIPPPDFQLGIGSGNHGAQTGRMLENIEKVILEERPDWVLVYGDTNSTIAGALAASKLHLPVAHVEAGLRSFNRKMPEEINRVLTDHCSNLLFAPTPQAQQNLRKEGIPEERIRQVGDIMFDVALFYSERAQHRSNVLSNLDLAPKNFILATIHRAENTDDPKILSEIMQAFSELSADRKIILPIHPRTRAALARTSITPPAGLHVIDPVGYLDMVLLEKNASLIVTDSGGVQKEAYFHSTPCVTLRTETEWVELLESGWNKLVPPNSSSEIVQGMLQMLNSTMDKPRKQFYGTGKTAELILKTLTK